MLRNITSFRSTTIGKCVRPTSPTAILLGIIAIIMFSLTLPNEALNCYGCTIDVTDNNMMHPCLDPDKGKVQSIKCENDLPDGNVYACVKNYNSASSNVSANLQRGCSNSLPDKKPCTTDGKDATCLCNDKDRCNNEPGLKVTKGTLIKSSHTTALRCSGLLLSTSALPVMALIS